MKLNLALLAFLFCVIAFTSCSIEKRIYEKGYHISWLHPKPSGLFADVSQGCSKGASQDLSKNLSKNLESGASLDLPQDLSENLSKNIEFKTPSDTITPTNKEDDYFGQKAPALPNEKKEAFFGPPIRKPKTIEQLKKSIGRDFKLVLLAMILGSISGGLLALIGPVSSGVGDGLVFLTILLVLSITGFIFYLIRGLFRIFKLTALKIFGKKDDAAINKREKKHHFRESEHQYLRRFGLWFGRNLFDPIGRLKILGLLLLIIIPIIVILNPH
ncbi:MAG: hypothetical protein ACEQSL_01835 [Sediminibacterium sp.]